MFIVFNKGKISAYTILLSTVLILFGIAFSMTNKNVIETSAATKEIPIYNVATEEKEIAFTMNCAWEANDIDSILETLSKHNTKITFFMVGDFVNKYPEAVKKISDAGHEIRKSFRHTPTCKYTKFGKK